MYWLSYGSGTWFGWIFIVFFGVLIVLVVFFLLREMIKKEKGPGKRKRRSIF